MSKATSALFPFGAGLSYTNFTYSNLRVRAGHQDGGLDLTFTVRNSGSRSGAEVPQVYVGPPPTQPAPMADRALAGFERVALRPGQAEEVTIHVSERALSYWSTAQQAWVVATGQRTVFVGSSSRDLRLSTSIMVANQ